MEAFARNAKGTKLELVPVGRPHSLFDFVEGRFKGLDTLRRMLTQARCQGVQTIVVEELEPSSDLLEENQDIQALIGKSFASHTFRLSLFSKTILSKVHIDSLENKDFIGYIIIKRDFNVGKSNVFHIYESVIRKSLHPHNYVRREQSWICLVSHRKFTVKGCLFAQQNGLTNVCVHAALRTAAASFAVGKELSYRQINQIVGIDHVAKYARDGMRSDEIANVLKSLGIGCFIGDFRLPADSWVPFQRVLYAGIESGFPAIVFFKPSRGKHHVIPIFGHTFNEDAWVPSADHWYFDEQNELGCIYSDAWLSMFVGHDDNVGSNLCIPKHYLETKRPLVVEPKKQQVGGATETNSVTYIISTAPAQVQLYFTKAEAAAVEALLQTLHQLRIKSLPWLTRLMSFQQKQQLVVRPLLITGDEYIAHLEKISDWEKNKVLPDALSEMKARISDELYWMIEFSVPELFSATKRKIAEVLLRADKPVGFPEELTSLVYVRLPGKFALPAIHLPDASNEKFRFIPSGLNCHTEVYGCEGHTQPHISAST